MTDLLSIGASGVRAYQSALTTTSENIANSGTVGYSRRSVDLQEVQVNGANSKQRVLAEGYGVILGGVVRSADAFRAGDVRTASADLSRSETSAAWLDRIQTALTGNLVGERLTSFFNASKAVAADPSAAAPRAQLLESGTSVAVAFAGTGTALARIGEALDDTAENAVTTLNNLATALNKVNDGLGRASSGSSNAAQLADQRDQLLDQISAITDTSVKLDQFGRASVQIGNASGPTLVAGVEAGTVTYVRNASGAVSFAVHRAGTTAIAAPQAGVLAGIADGAQRIVDAQAQLDSIATNFVTSVNAVQAQGRDLDGNAGAPLFASGATPTAISLVLADPRGLAAAAVGEGPRGNSNLKALEALRSSGGFEANVTSLITGNAATLASRQQVAEAQSAIRDGAIAARDNISGVNLDAEAVDLLRFQQAYQASARVIQVARETLQSIIDIR